MKWMRNRFLLITYTALLTILATIGCTSKEDPSEVLVVCGNHSCGELVMVTSDTSSDGWTYLEPALSPDRSQIVFTADWWAIPAEPRYDGDESFVNTRQILVIPNNEREFPALGLQDQFATLIEVFEFSLNLGNSSIYYVDPYKLDKGGPIWESDTSLIFWMEVIVGNRLYRADITDPALSLSEPLWKEPTDGDPSPVLWQHMEPALSPDGNWLAFTRSGCVIPDSFETCSGLSLWLLDMATAGIDNGFGATAFPLTNEYSRVESPRWHPEGNKLVFAGGMDVGGAGVGAGTELYTIDFNEAAALARNVELDHNLTRLTYTRLDEGDPISGVFNTSPVYSVDMNTIYFVSTRRAPAVTLHDRNIWRIPANGSLDPEIHFFTRADDMDPSINPDGSMLLSSALGFPTEMLDRLELDAYDRLVQENEDGALDEVQLRAAAAEERRLLEFFEGVMTHLYIYRP